VATAPYSNPTSTSQWATGLIDTLDTLLPKGSKPIPVTNNNVANIQRMIGAESGGNTAGFLRDNNPFNLNTWGSPHSSLSGGTIVPEFGSYVQTFPTAQAGITATANQLLQPNAAPTIAALQSNAPASVFGGSLASGAWGGQSYANATTFPTLTPANLTATPGGSTSSTPSKWQQYLNATGGYTPAGTNTGFITNPLGTIPAAVSSGIFGPITKFITAGAADITFVVFGLILIVIGLSVTFKGSGVDVMQSPAGGVAKDAAMAA